MKRLETSLSGITLQNPVIPASGTFGFGQEMAQFYDLNVLGGISLKGTTGEERFGNPTPRIAECREGLLNAVGLQNPGVDAVVAHELPAVRKLYDGVLLANISGFSVEEYVMVAEKFDKAPEIDILEINISCPNVRHGGMAFGTDPGAAQEVTAAVKAADAISAARPGARRENVENYIRRLQKLEELTGSWPGVDKAFAIQAGREIRIMVKPEVVTEDNMIILARDIAKKIEQELEYPGQIKVNVIRETKAIEFAK